MPKTCFPTHTSTLLTIWVKKIFREIFRFFGPEAHFGPKPLAAEPMVTNQNRLHHRILHSPLPLVHLVPIRILPIYRNYRLRRKPKRFGAAENPMHRPRTSPTGPGQLRHLDHRLQHHRKPLTTGTRSDRTKSGRAGRGGGGGGGGGAPLATFATIPLL